MFLGDVICLSFTPPHKETGGDTQKRAYKLLSQIIYVFAFTFDLTSTVTAK